MTPPGNPSAKDLAAIHGRAFADGGAWSAESIAALLADPLVETVASGPAFAMLRLLPDEAELLTIATAPEAQGQGRARALLRSLHEIALSNGAARVVLEVAENNTPARNLYASLGYKEIGQRAAYYRRKGGNVAALVLSCPLGGSESG